MKFVLLVLCLASVNASSLFHKENIELNASWNNFKKLYSKEYKNEIEENARRSIFEANLEMIKQHNSQGHSFTLAMNQFADLTHEEFKRTMNLNSRIKFAEKAISTVSMDFLENNETSIDWRTKGVVTPVRNQGVEGGSSSFAAVNK